MTANFTPGPSQLYFTVQDHVRRAFREGIPSLSHRSKEFESIFNHTTSGLRNLLDIPDGFYIFFTGSATEIFERSIQNLVQHKSAHFVNGAFSRRYFEIAEQLGRTATKVEVAPGEVFSTDYNLHPQTELIALTHNETSTGAALPLDFISGIRTKYPQALIALDAVSSLPYPDFDFAQFDSIFFSVQKGFGLPAGLGVWIVNDRCIAKAEHLKKNGVTIGTYHNLPTLLAHGKKNQTPETPNVLAIYLLGKVIEDLLRRGIQNIRKETEYKAALMYLAMQSHPYIKPFVQNKSWQSQTVIVADCGAQAERIVNVLVSKGLHPGDGYGEFKKTQLRFANFPAHSKEQYEYLADTLKSIQ